MKQEFEINWDKIQTAEDLMVIIKALGIVNELKLLLSGFPITISVTEGEEIPENVKELFELNLLIEK